MSWNNIYPPEMYMGQIASGYFYDYLRLRGFTSKEIKEIRNLLDEMNGLC